jgi:hypothetical protein
MRLRRVQLETSSASNPDQVLARNVDAVPLPPLVAGTMERAEVPTPIGHRYLTRRPSRSLA